MTRKSEAGQALVFGVVILGIALMGFAGLGIDVGMMRYQKRLLQNAADSAAIAGATNLAYSGVATAAQNAAAADGYTSLTSNSGTCPTSVTSDTITVNNPPQTGPHSSGASASSYVEVCMARLQPTFFMRILGVANQTVSARAVATNLGGGGNTDGCMFTLGSPTSSIEGVNVTGSVAINASSCGIVDNGNFNTTGKAFDVCTASFAVNGTAGSTGTGSTACGSKGVFCTSAPTCPATGAPAVGDPLAYLTAPPKPANATCPTTIGNSGSCTTTAQGTSVVTDSTTVLSPGTYSNLVFGKNSTTTLGAGTYYIDGTPGITFNGGGSVSGTNVTFYFTGSATINATGGGNKLDMQVSAPTTGTYAGILFYQDPNDLSPPTLGGDNNTNLTGALYFPTVQLTLFGNANLNASSSYSLVVAKALAMTGNPTLYLNSDYSSLPNGVSIIKNAILVE